MTKSISKPTSSKKWLISLLSGILFLIVSSSQLYTLTGKVFDHYLNFEIEYDGCPNNWGLLIHSIVFILLVRLLMY